MADTILFLKLGGSLITDKDTPYTPRMDVLKRLAGEIADARKAKPGLRILLGHGSGSFGHTSADRYGTREGVHTPEGWLGFSEVWKAARALNQIVIDVLCDAGLPVIAFPPSAIMLAHDGRPSWWEVRPLLAALYHGLLPVVNGDVVFDGIRGGTILSTEDVFVALAPAIKPHAILLAGLEEGVWADYPDCKELIKEITPANFRSISSQIKGSTSVDVTGGMFEKVQTMLELVNQSPGLKAVVFSGLVPGNLSQALLGK